MHIVGSFIEQGKSPREAPRARERARGAGAAGRRPRDGATRPRRRHSAAAARRRVRSLRRRWRGGRRTERRSGGKGPPAAHDMAAAAAAPLRPDERGAAAALMAGAFRSSPSYTWMMCGAGERRREALLERLFERNIALQVPPRRRQPARAAAL